MKGRASSLQKLLPQQFPSVYFQRSASSEAASEKWAIQKIEYVSQIYHSIIFLSAL